MAKTVQNTADFFVTGGTLSSEADSYVQRPADDNLFRLVFEGEYCNVLSARQTGKSSLMVRTAKRLKDQGVKSITIDLTKIGSDEISASQWYFGLISILRDGLELNVDEEAWWQARQEKSPVHRFSEFLREVVLKEILDPIVIFIDEIDSTLKLKFSDDFFATIRAAYNARSEDAAYKRLTFVLLGAARAADLVKNRLRTPYNIGVGIDVTDFQIEELSRFESVLENFYPGQGKQILGWVLDWTGGQPYLTQNLCAEVTKQAKGVFSKGELVNLVDQLFLKDRARTDTNLRPIRDRIKSNPYARPMLRIYGQVLANKQVMVEERSIEQNELKLIGLVKVSQNGVLQVRNLIYSRIFDEAWIKENMPVNTAQRIMVITSVVAIAAIALAGFFYYGQITQTTDVQAQTYTDSFYGSASQEVKITNLAGLFGLGDKYAAQARDLFNGLEYKQKLALFDLATPENVGQELLIVVREVYQYTENDAEGNALLRAMLDAIEGTTVVGVIDLAAEINDWIGGRDAAGMQDYQLAVSLYTRAFERSQKRKDDNAAILIDRAEAHMMLAQYAEVLMDYDTAIGIDAGLAGEIETTILGNQKLANYWRDNPQKFTNLNRAIASLTPLPSIVSPSTPTFTPIPVATLPIFTITPTIPVNVEATLRCESWLRDHHNQTTCP